jgi:predicted transcriptional regulator of viral defense system
MKQATLDDRIRRANFGIRAALHARALRFLKTRELGALIDANRDNWRLGVTPVAVVIAALVESGAVQRIDIGFPHRPLIVYAWEAPNPYDLIQSINDAGYFSHYTALHLHGVTEQVPKSIYFNVEQKLRGGDGELTQAGINRAFKSKCRTTNNVAAYGDYRVHLLNGGNTKRLGVVELQAPGAKGPLRVSNLERTLIDSVVRPIYAGGPQEVAKAYVRAEETVSVNRLAAYLRTLGYVYPYHQAIGFYMERAGYRGAQLDLLREFPIEFDFYLDYAMKDPKFDSTWRIFYPEGL